MPGGRHPPPGGRHCVAWRHARIARQFEQSGDGRSRPTRGGTCRQKEALRVSSPLVRNIDALSFGLAVALALAGAGCAMTARTSLGPSASPAGGEERASAAFGVGVAADKGQIILLGAGQPGTRSVVAVGGIEYDRDLRSTERPLGIRVRVEGGAQFEYKSRAASRDGMSGLVAVVPGVWWMPFQTAYDAHRLVMAIEPRIGVVIPEEDPSAVGPFFDLAFVMQWEWVPCTLFGMGSCRNRVRTAAP